MSLKPAVDTSATLWALEVQFWTGDAGFYERHLAADCVMAFPPPVGVISREEIVQSISRAPRWRSVEFEGQRELWLDDSAVLLIYSAVAQREGRSAPYRATASSAYRRRDGTWELAFHQQTPHSGGQ